VQNKRGRKKPTQISNRYLQSRVAATQEAAEKKKQEEEKQKFQGMKEHFEKGILDS